MGEPRAGDTPSQPIDTGPAGPAGRPPKPARTRAGGAWVGLVVGAIVLILLLIFVLQNLSDVRVSFIGTDSSIPLGVALLLAAVAGALIVAVPGSARIVQLRRANRTAQRALNRT